MPQRDRRRAVYVSVFATLFIFFGRFGYDVGISDQDEFLPFLVHLLDGQVLSNDWFVNAQLDSFSIRLPLVLLLKPFATLFGPPVAVLIVYLLAFVLAVVATHLLARTLFNNDLVAVATTVIGLAFTKQWTLGGNDVLVTMLVPSLLAWASALWGLLATSRKQTIRAGLWCGVAVLFQPLVGIHVAVLCSVIVTAQILSSRNEKGLPQRFGALLHVPIIAIIVGAPVLLPVILSQMQSPLSRESVYIFTLMRAPHHFIPSLFNQSMMWRFYLLAITGMAAFAWTLRLRSDIFFEKETRIFLFAALAALSVMLAVAFLNVSVLHSPTLTKLQLFKTSVIIKLILVSILSATAIPRLLSDRITEKLSRWLIHPTTWRVTAGAFVILLAVSWSYEPLTSRFLPAVARNSSPDAELYTWIRKHTPLNAIFAAPPDHSGFRYYARRPLYVNFKAFPYHEKDIQEWYRRILTQSHLAGSSFSDSSSVLPDFRGISGLKKLTRLYESSEESSLFDFVLRENIQYLLRRTQIEPSGSSGFSDHFSRVFQNRQWNLYRVRNGEF